MCGITGFLGDGDQATLQKMNAVLAHRGPDDQGAVVQNLTGAAGTVGLAQCRLAIIDLSPAGHQPMSNEDGSVTIIFNGEIYNFAELRAGLTGRHIFQGKSDTEVIIHLYEEIGTEVFSRIHGMFAIAIFDKKTDQVILARDRMGKKPLFWGVHDGTFMFGSELKALIQHPSFKKEIDLASLNKYFLYEYVPTPATIFKNTYKLEPGTFMVWDSKMKKPADAKKYVFWKPTFLPKETSFDDSLVKLNDSFGKAVSDRLISDVPLGVFLSGGIDSSAIAYYAAKANPGKVKTFSIGFKEASFDESAWARMAAKHLGTEHHEKILSVEDCLSLVPKIGQLLDEPMADASIVPTYLLSQFTREHVTVALGGDGGDELFAGYDTFLAHKMAGIYDIVPNFLRKGIRAAVFSLPTSFSNMSWDFKIKRFTGGFEGPLKYRDQRWMGAFDHGARQKLFSKNVRDAIAGVNEFDDIDRYLADADSREKFDELALVYERMYMMDQVLVKVDRASMMNSLEVRAPFLDTRVVDLANHMPIDFKFRGLTRKYILKKLMEGKLPQEIIYRKKKGFGMPIAEWLRGSLKPLVLDFLGPKSLQKMGLFDPAYVAVLIEDHFSGKRDNRKQIWTLLVFAMWYRNYVE
jgi:asparagine synthase (glutamine-hydrolysing)